MSQSPSGPPSTAASSDAAASARDAERQARIEASPFELSQEPVTPDGPPEPAAAGSFPAPAYEHLGELPTTYGTQSVYLVAYDPHQLFAYWDMDWAAAGDATHALHVCRADGQVETQVDISSGDAGRYLAVRQPGGTYFVELCRHGRDGSWLPLAFSGRVTMPPEGLSGETEPKFATLPFHLSFQRLLELIQGAMGQGEELTDALARLQRGDHPAATASLLHALDGLDGEGIHTLELLLGQQFNVTSGSQDAGAQTLLRDRREILASGGGFGSEGLSSAAFGSEHGTIHAPAAGGREGLSSGVLARGGFGSESLFSGPVTTRVVGREGLPMGFFGPGVASDTLCAFVAGMSSETLSSHGLSSEAFAPGAGPDSAGIDRERAEVFRRALGNNLDVLSSLFDGTSSSSGSGFSPGGW